MSQARLFAARISTWCGSALLLVYLLANNTIGAETRPNVLLVMTDDQGFGDVASHGNPYLKTPVLDALAAQGARFQRFFVSPVCAPTRASLLTGRYHLRTGVHGVTRGHENMRPEEITVAELFLKQGYATGAFGKWHNGRHMPYHPNGQGFQEFVGFCGGHWNTYFDPPLEHNGQPLPTKGYITDVLTTEAIEFMRKNRARPWFCYVPYNAPHSPWRVPDADWERYDRLGLDAKAQCAYAMVENIDTNLGRLLETLDELQLAQQTIVLFLTDNGANSDRYNAGMLGRKGSVDEGGTRVPLFIRYPNVILPGTQVEPIAFHLDLLPTLAEWCGIELEEDHRARLDGRSLVPLLTADAAAVRWPERTYFTENYRGGIPPDAVRVGVRTDRWRATRQRGRWRLFDMSKDPGQEQDLANQHPDVVRDLATAFETWFQDVLTAGVGDPPIPVGHATRDSFELPANEAALRPAYGEGIKYTGDTPAGFANAWIHAWTSKEAYPEWTIDVVDPGVYGVELDYTCRREDVGVSLVVQIGDQVLKANVPRAFDPPLLVKPDRIYSNNYQDKANWARLEFGTVDLPPGPQTLTVRIVEFAREVEGSEAVDLRAVRLTRRR